MKLVTKGARKACRWVVSNDLSELKKTAHRQYRRQINKQCSLIAKGDIDFEEFDETPRTLVTAREVC